MKQGDDTWMQVISDVEDAVDLCRLDLKSLTREDAIRMVAVLQAYVTDNLLTLSEESPLQVLNSGDLRRDLL